MVENPAPGSVEISKTVLRVLRMKCPHAATSSYCMNSGTSRHTSRKFHLHLSIANAMTGIMSIDMPALSDAFNSSCLRLQLTLAACAFN